MPVCLDRTASIMAATIIVIKWLRFLRGMKQLMAGGGVALIGTTLVPLLANLF